MAKWNQTTVSTGFDAQKYTSEIISNRTSDREGNNRLSSKFENISVVGINVAQIPNMRAKIREYVQGIQDHLDTINTETDPTVAFKGSGIEVAIKDYMTSVVAYCKTLVSQLLAFSDKLYKVEEAWKASDTNISRTVTGSNDNLKASGAKTYTEQNM